MEIKKKIKIELPYNPFTLRLAIHPRDAKSACHRDICIAFIMALFRKELAWVHISEEYGMLLVNGAFGSTKMKNEMI